MFDLNLLVSFPYFNKRIIEMVRTHKRLNLLVDSGAFTAKKQGKSISMDEYCSFIEALGQKPYTYFMLDVVGDREMTYANWHTMLKRGFKPIPIWTRGESVKVLEEMFDHGGKVGIGGITANDKKPGGRMQTFMKVASKYPKARTHWLGFTKLEWVRTFRPSSVDSSSWTSGLRYGAMDVYLGSGRFSRVEKADMSARPSDEVAHVLAAQGFSVPAFQRKAAWHGGKSLASRVCVNSWLRYSADVQRRLGTHYHLAAASTDAVEMIMAEHDRQLRERAAHGRNDCKLA